MKFTNRIALLLVFCTALSVHVESRFGFSSGKRDVVKEELSKYDLADKNLLQIAETGYCFGGDFTYASSDEVRKALEVALDKYKNGEIKYIILVHCVFGNIDLSNLNLDGAILRYSNFTGANLSNCSLRNASVCGAIFDGVNASGACMDRILAWRSYWCDSNLSNASFKKASLGDANIVGSNVNGANFDGAYLGDARIHSLKGFEDASFENVTDFPEGSDVSFEINSQNSLLYAFLKKCKGIIEKMINNDIPADY